MRGIVKAAAAALAAGVLGVVQAAGQASPKAPATTAAEVIARNVAARGGLSAWRQVNTMVWLGHLERAGRSDGPRIPFVMQLQRPNRTRFEIKEQYSQFTRIFDGNHGWRVRPGNNGQPDVKSFSKGEVDFAREEFAIDGPLIDYEAKGVTAGLDGIDMLEGRKAYRLSLKLASGVPRKVWVDTETNLEVRYDRPATNPLAPGAPVSVFYDGYATVDGLTLPNRLITRSAPEPAPAASGADGPVSAKSTAPANDSVRQTGDRLVIDKIIINPKLDAEAFLPPSTPMHRGGKVLIPGDGTPTGAPSRTIP